MKIQYIINNHRIEDSFLITYNGKILAIKNKDHKVIIKGDLVGYSLDKVEILAGIREDYTCYRLKKSTDLVIADMKNFKLYGKIDNIVDVDKKLKELGNNYQIIDFYKFLKLKNDNILDKPIKEITEDHYIQSLNSLPPLNWSRYKSYDYFFSSEFYDGSITNQFYHDKITNKYYNKLVDYNNTNTWIKGAGKNVKK